PRLRYTTLFRSIDAVVRRCRTAGSWERPSPGRWSSPEDGCPARQPWRIRLRRRFAAPGARPGRRARWGSAPTRARRRTAPEGIPAGPSASDRTRRGIPALAGGVRRRPSVSRLRAAGDVDDLAGDERRALVGEEGHHVGDVLGLAGTPDRDRADRRLGEVLEGHPD